MKLWCTALALLFGHAVAGIAADDTTEGVAEDVERPVQSPNLQVTVSTTFPQSEIFGIKLVNGRPTKAVLSIENQETVPVKISYVGGSLWTLGLGGQESQNVRNLTINRFDLEIAAGQKETITYSFATEIHAQDLRLQLAALIVKEGLQFHSIQAYNETVTVVEAPTSLFDPQLIFLYLVLASLFGGICYFVYQTWVTTFFPQKRRGGKGGERAKTSTNRLKKVDPADQLSVVGGDGPAVTSGAKAYDEDWIPLQHLQRPETKRSKSGTPTPKSKQRNVQ